MPPSPQKIIYHVPNRGTFSKHDDLIKIPRSKRVMHYQRLHGQKGNETAEGWNSMHALNLAMTAVKGVVTKHECPIWMKGFSPHRRHRQRSSSFRRVLYFTVLYIYSWFLIFPFSEELICFLLFFWEEKNQDHMRWEIMSRISTYWTLNNVLLMGRATIRFVGWHRPPLDFLIQSTFVTILYYWSTPVAPTIPDR